MEHHKRESALYGFVSKHYAPSNEKAGEEKFP